MLESLLGKQFLLILVGVAFGVVDAGIGLTEVIVADLVVVSDAICVAGAGTKVVVVAEAGELRNYSYDFGI